MIIAKVLVKETCRRGVGGGMNKNNGVNLRTNSTRAAHTFENFAFEENVLFQTEIMHLHLDGGTWSGVISGQEQMQQSGSFANGCHNSPEEIRTSEEKLISRETALHFKIFFGTRAVR